MNHKGTVTIETERLILRRFTENDAEKAFKNWTSDDEVTKFLRWKTHSDLSVTRGYIDFLLSNYPNPEFYEWVIELKTLGEPIGSIGIVKQDGESVEVGYCIGKPWWNRGFTSEALAAVIGFFFKEIGAERVWSEHDPRNPNSGKVMQKCGMRFEKTVKDGDVNNQGVCDTSIYAIDNSSYSN